MTLHDAIVQVLMNSKKPLTTSQIADELNRLEIYQKKDRSIITDFQIHGRTRKYPQLFDREKSLVFLKGERNTVESKHAKPEKETLKVSKETINEDQLMDIFKLESMLMDSKKFMSAGTIDSIVPTTPGIYCIRIKNEQALPTDFRSELTKRAHDILYIGIASQSLSKRMLNQELRANGHGTFFRSLGAMLGFKPPFNSLARKKNKRNYHFSIQDEKQIISWINDNLWINWIETSSGLEEMETKLISKFQPLMNLAKNPGAMQQLSILRKACVDIANGSVAE